MHVQMSAACACVNRDCMVSVCNEACCLCICKGGKGGLIVVHIHAYWACLNGACCLYMCKQGHAACACVNRACCRYMCEFIYMQTRGCCVFMCKWILMV